MKIYIAFAKKQQRMKAGAGIPDVQPGNVVTVFTDYAMPRPDGPQWRDYGHVVVEVPDAFGSAPEAARKAVAGEFAHDLLHSLGLHAFDGIPECRIDWDKLAAAKAVDVKSQKDPLDTPHPSTCPVVTLEELMSFAFPVNTDEIAAWKDAEVARQRAAAEADAADSEARRLGHEATKAVISATVDGPAKVAMLAALDRLVARHAEHRDNALAGADEFAATKAIEATAVRARAASLQAEYDKG